jgi:hypothetical protein
VKLIIVSSILGASVAVFNPALKKNVVAPQLRVAGSASVLSSPARQLIPILTIREVEIKNENPAPTIEPTPIPDPDNGHASVSDWREF